METNTMMLKGNTIKRVAMVAALTVAIIQTVVAIPASHYKVTIPFDFTVDGKVFESGDYTIDVGGKTLSRDVLLIRSVKGKASKLMMVKQSQRIGKARQSKLVFAKSNGIYVLAEMRTRSVGIKFADKSDRIELEADTVEVTLKK